MNSAYGNDSLQICNEGINAFNSGEIEKAITLWQSVLENRLELPIELIALNFITHAIFGYFINISEGTKLSLDETKLFNFGNKCLQKYAIIFSNEIEIDDDIIRDLIEQSKKHYQRCTMFIARAGHGWYIFSGDETVQRLLEWGMMGALSFDDTKMEESVALDRIQVLLKAIELLDLSKETHYRWAIDVYARLSGLLAELRKIDQAMRYTQKVLYLILQYSDAAFFEYIKLDVNKQNRFEITYILDVATDMLDDLFKKNETAETKYDMETNLYIRLAMLLSDVNDIERAKVFADKALSRNLKSNDSRFKIMNSILKTGQLNKQ